MQSVRVKLIYTEIEGVSDRTARNLLKSLSKVAREAQVREFNDVLRIDELLSRRERQSLRDKLQDELQAAPVYYLDRAESGSLEVTITLTGLLIWFLQNTLGETIKEAWKLTAMHGAIIGYVTESRPKKLAEIVIEEVRRHDFLSGRAVVQSSTIVESEDSETVEIYIIPDEDLDIDIVKMTEGRLVANGNQLRDEIGDE